MKQQLRVGSNSIKIQGQSFGQAYLLVQGVAPATLTVADFVLTNLRIRIDLNQADIKESTSFNAVGPVAKSCFDAVHPSFVSDMTFNATGQTCMGKLLSGSTSASAFRVPLLDGGYILRGDDNINFVIDILPGFFTTNSTQSSTVNLVIESANDIEQIDINLPIYEPITTDRQSPGYNYDACSEIMLLNAVNGSNYNFAGDPFNSIDVRSKHVSDYFDSNTLADKRSFDTDQSARLGTSSIYKVEPSTLENVSVNLSVNTNAVTPGSQFLYIRKTFFSSQVSARSISHQNKVSSRKLNSRGITPQSLEYIRKTSKLASYRNSK